MQVLIIGGGAAGMAAALTAAARGHSVTILERQARVGRKLLTTGNGRCNLTNQNASVAHYHGENPDFCRFALEKHTPAETLDWFAQLGLMTVTEEGGRVYPLSNMAGSVLDVLRYALEQPGITLRAGETVTAVQRKGGRFTVETESGAYQADRVILAAGGAAGAKVGGVMDGYRIAKALGHHRTALYPSLVQLKTDPTYPRALKGVKAECAVTILRGERIIAENRGEVLFTEYGVSGPVIFDISRAVATGGEGLTCCLDLLPEVCDAELAAYLAARREAMASHEAATLLTGALQSRLGQMVMKYAGLTQGTAGALTDRQLRQVAAAVRQFALPITGVCGFDQAQVTAGGLRTEEFDPSTMESLLCPGFFACGEVLDVDGDCGGYNLQWAWASGRLAGESV